MHDMHNCTRIQHCMADKHQCQHNIHGNKGHLGCIVIKLVEKAFIGMHSVVRQHPLTTLLYDPKPAGHLHIESVTSQAVIVGARMDFPSDLIARILFCIPFSPAKLAMQGVSKSIRQAMQTQQAHAAIAKVIFPSKSPIRLAYRGAS